MTSVVQCGSLCGARAVSVRVEVSVVRGLPGIDIVGLPEAAVRESRVRVQAALRNSGFNLPEQRFVVNLAPGDLRKSGAGFDLPIAIALLAHTGSCAPLRLPHTLLIGELSLDGQLRPSRGMLAQLAGAVERGLSDAIVPQRGSGLAQLVAGIDVRTAQHLSEVVEFLNGTGELGRPAPIEACAASATAAAADLSEVRGQLVAKRALEIAAAGQHDLLLIGPPGTGKSMLARRLPGLLPVPTDAELLELATIASAAGLGAESPSLVRPFRAPHHTCSEVALVGGGDPIRPGEVTLAHHGVLFLDELPEFRRPTLEALRPTMESGQAVIVRARERAVMPARPLIVAAMNPCPCGYHGHKRKLCRCMPEQVQRYRGRISGPLLDRFDLHVWLPPLSVRELEAAPLGEPSAAVRARVEQAHERRRVRRQRRGARAADSLDALAAELEPEALRFLHRTLAQLELSLRAYGKVLRVARTIADLASSDAVQVPHVAEAVHYRLLDRDRNSQGARSVGPARAELAPATNAASSAATSADDADVRGAERAR